MSPTSYQAAPPRSSILTTNKEVGQTAKSYLSSTAEFRLKEELQTKLNLPRRRRCRRDHASGRRRRSRCGRINDGVWGAEIRVIHNVEELAAELKIQLFGDRSIFAQGNIQFREPRP